MLKWFRTSLVFSYFFLSRPLLLVGVGGASEGVELRPLLLEGVEGRGELGGDEVFEVLLDADVREDLLRDPLVAGSESKSIMELPLVEVVVTGGVDCTHLFLAGGGVRFGGVLVPEPTLLILLLVG